MDLLTRMLIACLSVWFIDQCLAKFGVTNGAKVPWKSIIEIIVIVLAALFIVLGWSLNLPIK